MPWPSQPRGFSDCWNYANLGSELEQAPVERIAYHHVAAIFHPEDRARATIDEQLAKAGWLVQSREQINLGAGLGVAVREFATGIGPVDYALFIDRTLCGVLEAKPDGTNFVGFLG